MDGVVLVARLLLAAVFAVSALSKLADRAGTRAAMVDFGAPARLAAPASWLLSLAELAVAIALIPIASAWYAALGVLALLAIFGLAIGVTMSRGRSPDCHCFGQLRSEPVGWRTLVRNGVLAAVAALILTAGRTSPGASLVVWLGRRSLSEGLGLALGVAVAITLVVEGRLLLHLLRRSRRVFVRLVRRRPSAYSSSGRFTPVAEPARAGVPIGFPAPEISLDGLDGDTISLDNLRARGKPVMLLFSTPGCAPCRELMPEVGRWQRAYHERLTLAVISRGTVEENRAKGDAHGITMTLLQRDRELEEQYQIIGTPTAVIVNLDGKIGSRLAQGADEIRQLINRIAAPPVADSPRQTLVLRGHGRGDRR